MERVWIEVEIIDGKTVLLEKRETLLPFAYAADLTETLGQFNGTIETGAPKEKKLPQPKPQPESRRFSPESFMDGMVMQ